MEPYRPNCYKIPELNGLRVLLVFIVSWYHFWQQSWLTPSIGSYSLDYLLRAGYMPVDGTILLSGFLLFLPYARAMLLGEAVPNTKQFYQRRIMRIVPSYYFVTLALLFWRPIVSVLLRQKNKPLWLTTLRQTWRKRCTSVTCALPLLVTQQCVLWSSSVTK